MNPGLLSRIIIGNGVRRGCVAGALAVLGAVHAYAQSLPAAVQVVASCRFEASSAVLDFGSIDATRKAAATAAVQLGYRCIRGVTPVVALGAGLNLDSSSGLRQLANGADRIPYTLAVTGAPAPGAGLKATLSLTLTGSISVAAMQAARAGSYADTVVLSISP